MRRHLMVGIYFALAGATSGCALDFVDVSVEQPAHFAIAVDSDSEADSIRISGALFPGLNGSGKRRTVITSLQIEGQFLIPSSMAEDNWEWETSLPASIAAGGHLTIVPPLLEDVAAARQMVIPIPLRDGSREISISPGQQLELRFALSPIPSEAAWQVRLTDSDGRWFYNAASRSLPPGQIVIWGDMIPPTARAPYKVELEIGTSQSNEPEPGTYHVRVHSRARLTWVVAKE